ncbi:PspC domain-containing protein [Flocculibacter collagenilyticus]|uniref:PspC domain-containing protein n=1 Tax=Flocculibacter collagenilyticus TaxID=2744479 RepID=UPI0018F2C0F3|nr:PspC domain-containing protein [Flocculibacter collagenilyticus]
MNNYHAERKWYKDRINSKISGVCAGIAQRLNLERWVVRLAAIFLLISAPFLAIVGYFVASVAMPTRYSYS